MLPIARKTLAVVLAAAMLLVAVPIQAAHDHHDNADEDSEAENAENADDHAEDSSEQDADDEDGDSEATSSEEDTTPPTTEHVLHGETGDAGYFTSAVHVELVAEDEESGVNETYYQLDEGPTRVYEDPVEVADDGEHSMTYWSVDEAGNVEEPNTVNFTIDASEPTVSVELDGVEGEDGWHRSTVRVTIHADDDTSGVDEVTYRLDEGDWQDYEAPFDVQEAGEHRLDVRVSDEAGNVQTVSEQIRIDREAPHVEMTTPQAGYVYVDDMRIAETTGEATVLLGNKTIAANASDDTSGVSELAFAVNGEVRHRSNQTPHEWVFSASEHRASVQSTELRVSASDHAGNDAADALTVSTIPTSPEGLEATFDDRNPDGAFVEADEDDDGDGIPATVDVWNPVLREYESVAVDPDDERSDPTVPENITVRVPHNVSVGEDDDGDGLPGEVTVETRNVTVPAEDPTNASLEHAPNVTVPVDPDDEDASQPADTREVSVQVPSNASAEDEDGDGTPDRITVETTRVTANTTTQNVSSEAGDDHVLEVPDPSPPQPPEPPVQLGIRP